jgi:acetyl esterase/lipase
MTYTTRSFPSARPMRADVFGPDLDADPPGDERTAVIVLHGGGWRMGGPEHLHPRCQALSRRGFTAVAAEYRLLGEAPWPAALHDVRAAIRWVRDNADELGVEPDRVVVQGHSAGAHLGLLAAYTAEAPEDRVAAVVAFYPPIGFYPAAVPGPEPGRPRLPRPRSDGLAPAWLLLTGDSEDEEVVRAASPIDQISDSCPPTMIVQGTADPVVRHSTALTLLRALVDAGVAADLHLYHGVGHEFDVAPSMTEAVQDEAARFYRRTVSQAAEVAAELARFDPFRRD